MQPRKKGLLTKDARIVRPVRFLSLRSGEEARREARGRKTGTKIILRERCIKQRLNNAAGRKQGGV